MMRSKLTKRMAPSSSDSEFVVLTCLPPVSKRYVHAPVGLTKFVQGKVRRTTGGQTRTKNQTDAGRVG